MGVNRGGEHSTVLATTREYLDAMLMLITAGFMGVGGRCYGHG